MNPTWKGILFILGGFIRLIDFFTDAYYVYSQEFHDDWLFYASIFSLSAPTVIFCLFGICSGLSECLKLRKGYCCLNLSLGLSLALFDPLGLSLCIYLVV